MQPAPTTTLAPCSDSEDIRASLDDPERFAPVFRRHFSGIYGFLARRIGPDLADELAGEVFVRAFAARRGFDGAYPSARPWLYAIALDLVRRHHRAERRQMAAYARLDRDVTRAADERAADRVDAQRLAPAVARALQKLRRADRDLLLLVAWADFSYEDAAQALGVPVGTVKSRVHRSRAKLRSRLETHEL